jgi:hypothetical protein
MKISVLKREVFGVIRFYPQDVDTKTICDLMNKKTLSDKHLFICKQAGWDISCENESYII